MEIEVLLLLLGLLFQSNWNKSRLRPARRTELQAFPHRAVNRTAGLWVLQSSGEFSCSEGPSIESHSATCRCHHTGGQSERLPWSTASRQIYHFKSLLCAWPTPPPFFAHKLVTHTGSPAHSLLYPVFCEDLLTNTKLAMTELFLRGKRNIWITPFKFFTTVLGRADPMWHKQAAVWQLTSLTSLPVEVLGT